MPVNELAVALTVTTYAAVALLVGVARPGHRVGRLMLLGVTACGGSPSATAQESGATRERPFSVTPVADFDTPWAMAFLPGSGVPITINNMRRRLIFERSSIAPTRRLPAQSLSGNIRSRRCHAAFTASRL